MNFVGMVIMLGLGVAHSNQASAYDGRAFGDGSPKHLTVFSQELPGTTLELEISDKALERSDDNLVNVVTATFEPALKLGAETFSKIRFSECRVGECYYYRRSAFDRARDKVVSFSLSNHGYGEIELSADVSLKNNGKTKRRDVYASDQLAGGRYNFKTNLPAAWTAKIQSSRSNWVCDNRIYGKFDIENIICESAEAAKLMSPPNGGEIIIERTHLRADFYRNGTRAGGGHDDIVIKPNGRGACEVRLNYEDGDFPSFYPSRHGLLGYIGTDKTTGEIKMEFSASVVHMCRGEDNLRQLRQILVLQPKP